MRSLLVWQLQRSFVSRLTGGGDATNYGASSIQGRRPSQEDRYYACPKMSGASDVGMFCVFDGHGGDRAASYATEMMHKHLAKSKAFKVRDIATALQQVFYETEREFLNIAGREGLRDGTTAVVAVLHKQPQEKTETLHLAHVGDSRGVLCKGGEAVCLTQDHKPDLDAEKKRIEALGGFVSFVGCWRAMGILAMSRAIGDLFLKPYVSAEPDVSSFSIEKNDEFVVLASDGVYDVFDNDQVVQIVRQAQSPEAGAKLLTESAFAAGSLDNITAIVVALPAYKPGRGMPASVAEPSKQPMLAWLASALLPDDAPRPSHGRPSLLSVASDRGLHSAWFDIVGLC